MHHYCTYPRAQKDPSKLQLNYRKLVRNCGVLEWAMIILPGITVHCVGIWAICTGIEWGTWVGNALFWLWLTMFCEWLPED